MVGTKQKQNEDETNYTVISILYELRIKLIQVDGFYFTKRY